MDAGLAEELKRAGFAMIETHISRVFLREGDVFKCKRPVALGFLDYSTLALRKHACRAEVELNARLAPDVYLGIAGLVRDADGSLCFVPEASCGQVLDWAVHMRRLRDEDRADVLLARGALSPQDLECLARQLAAFHGSARADDETRRLGGYEAVAQNVHENFSQLAALEPHLTGGELAALQAFQVGFLERMKSRFGDRARAGFVRDGHGDLRLEHCYRRGDGSFLIIDCIEFNDRFRYADVCADVAFLAMDLRHRGQPELAELFVAAYAKESADYGLFDMLDFYESYRATVRGKVMAIAAQDDEADDGRRARASAESRRFLVQALAPAGRPLGTPTLYVVFGLIAAGKSSLSRALALRDGLVQLSADETRKELLGVARTTACKDEPFRGAYGADTTQRVYDTMFARARYVLASGRSVILDASFRARVHRDRARALAVQQGAVPLFIECHVDRALALARLAQRAKGPHVSDGRAEIYDQFAAEFERADELRPGEHLCIDTAGDPERALDRVPAARLE